MAPVRGACASPLLLSPIQDPPYTGLVGLADGNAQPDDSCDNEQLSDPWPKGESETGGRGLGLRGGTGNKTDEDDLGADAAPSLPLRNG